MDDAQVVITVPRAKKGAWVAASRAQGRKLTDWLVERIERIDASSGASAACAPAQPAQPAAPLTARQFNALAALMHLSTDTPRGRALRAVLCDGVPVASAARAEGIAHQPVYRAVESAKKTLALAESCVRGSIL